MQQIELEKSFKSKSNSNKAEDSLTSSQDTTMQDAYREAQELKDLKRRYKKFGIYLYPCNKCSKGQMALHEDKCLKPNCGSKNYYFDKEIEVNPEKWTSCLKELGFLH